MTTLVKICGVTRVDDAGPAARADFVGLNFWPSSKRAVTAEHAVALAAAVRAAGAARLVGVFVDATIDDVAAVVAKVGLDVVQLHGVRAPAALAALATATDRPVWHGVAVTGPAALDGLEAWPVDAILLDTPTPGRGGSGVTFDWSLARDAHRRFPARRFVLAGGLTPDNVARAIAEVTPWAVDVASGVEASPGVKDAGKVAAFIAAARGL